MSFVDAYARVEKAFEDPERVIPATIGDVFRPGPAGPQEILGDKIEKSATLAVPRGAGTLSVATTCRIVRPDPELIDISKLITLHGQPMPKYFLRHLFDWEESSGGQRVGHHTRVVRGFSEEEMREADNAWTTYAYQDARWQEERDKWLKTHGSWLKDYELPADRRRPEEPSLSFVARGYTNPILDPIDNDPIVRHCETLVDIGTSHLPSRYLGYYRGTIAARAFPQFKPQEFSFLTQWVLETDTSNPVQDF